MPGHGDEGRTQFRKGHRQAACGLRCVQNQGNPPCPAQSRHTLHRQDITKNVGDMVADHTGYALELAAEGLHQFPRLEQRAGRHAYVCSQCMQRPGDGIVLITGDKHGIARLDQGFDGNIEGVGRIEGEDHLLRSLYLKKLRTACRQAKAVSAASMAGACPPRPGVAICTWHKEAARGTAAAFAAWSRHCPDRS